MNSGFQKNNKKAKKRLSLFVKILLLVGLAFLIAFIVSISIWKSELEASDINWRRAENCHICTILFGTLFIVWLIGFAIMQLVRFLLAYEGNDKSKKLGKESEKRPIIRTDSETKNSLDRGGNKYPDDTIRTDNKVKSSFDYNEELGLDDYEPTIVQCNCSDCPYGQVTNNFWTLYCTYWHKIVYRTSGCTREEY